MYYDDAGVRTHLTAREGLPFDLRCNFRNVFVDDAFPVPLEAAARIEAIECLRTYVGRDLPAYFAALAVSRRFRITAREATALIHQAIWRRELRVDLFRPFLMNKPLWPEVVDVLVHYQDWFKR
jgi:hypothetical protein